MITAETLTTLLSFTPAALTRAVEDTGYVGPPFTSSRFLGITNGGQFCYRVVFHVANGGTDSGKVFLTYNPSEGRVTADTDLTLWA
jgi:hypothetical protein